MNRIAATQEKWIAITTRRLSPTPAACSICQSPFVMQRSGPSVVRVALEHCRQSWNATAVKRYFAVLSAHVVAPSLEQGAFCVGCDHPHCNFFRWALSFLGAGLVVCVAYALALLASAPPPAALSELLGFTTIAMVVYAFHVSFHVRCSSLSLSSSARA